MRSIERRYRALQKENPYRGSYICLAEAIKYQKFSKKNIAQWFNRLIEDEELSEPTRRQLIRHLVSLSNTRQEDVK